jgi:hypothetical protein
VISEEFDGEVILSKETRVLRKSPGGWETPAGQNYFFA